MEHALNKTIQADDRTALDRNVLVEFMGENLLVRPSTGKRRNSGPTILRWERVVSSSQYCTSSIRQEDPLSTFAALRALAALVIAPVIAWSLHLLLLGSQDFLLAAAALPGLTAQLNAPDWRFVLISIYGHLVVGFVLAGVAAKFTPALNQVFVRLTILGSIGIGALMALSHDYGTVQNITLALALVTGTVAYSLRMRGFTERVYAD